MGAAARHDEYTLPAMRHCREPDVAARSAADSANIEERRKRSRPADRLTSATAPSQLAA